jgi:hypothetical protein
MMIGCRRRKKQIEDEIDWIGSKIGTHSTAVEAPFLCELTARRASMTHGPISFPTCSIQSPKEWKIR